jgi:glycosyltransferase involved in cell wall biosynthesis
VLDISVVINTRDRADSLRVCLNAMTAQTLAPDRWEIVISDDGSETDAAKTLAERYNGKSECRYLWNPHAGCAAARNAGIDAARGRFVLFLGDDVICDPDGLEQHLLAHEKYPNSAIVGCYEWTPEVPSETFGQWVNTLRFDKIRNRTDASWRFFYTGNASVERETLLDIGGFDENFTRYAWEDMEIGYRLERHGTRIAFHPRANALHYHPFVSLKSLCRAEYEQAFSAVYFFGKWGHCPEVAPERFWQGDPADVAIGPRWRKTLAKMLIRAIETVGPVEPLLRPLYERLLWSCRYEGLRDGAKHYAKILEQWQNGEPSSDPRRLQS